ncbi:AsmA family protein [Vibrio ordalii]|uniref:Cell envelope biogenesis protein AsmA n=1 Tax=Vibrio ordalii FS-238 TaxID=617133 RepID=A0A853QVJ3_9VIBR|nr:AsmA family protein [Vibrio ordalii]OEE33245.1 cell envelope biogenesis protein AsmA [Vibrio ordalii FS-238]
MKKLFLFIAIIIGALIAAALALVLLVNPNQFKPLIVEQAKQKTGLDLVIEGDISWRFFPSLGFELGQTELRNPQGFSAPNLFKVEQVGIEISVMPLLDKQLEIGNIRLNGAAFHLETLKDGRSNLDSLTQAAPQPAASSAVNETKPAQEETSSVNASNPVQEWTINLAGVSVENALLEIQDRKAGTHTKLYDVAVNLSEFAVDKWTSATFAAKGKNNQQNFAAEGRAEFKLAAGFKDYALKNVVLDASFSDPSNQIDSAKIELATFEFDKKNALSFSVKGKAADLKLDAKGSAQLTLDKAMSLVKIDTLVLDTNLEGTSLPQSPMQIGLTSNIRFDLSKNQLDVLLSKLTANALEFDGDAKVTLAEIPKIRFNMHSPNIDLDEFLGLANPATASSAVSESQASSGSTSAAPATVIAEVEPDLSALKTLDVQGKVTIDKFKANNARLQNVQTSFSVDRGIVNLTSFSANLYQGTIQATARLDATKVPATYSAKKSVKGVQVLPLLKDVLNNEMLQGTGNIDVDVKGRSLTPTGIQQNLVGTVNINFADGAVNGINVAHLIRSNYAKIKGKKVDDDPVKKTDFSAMTATLKLNKGEVTTNNLAMQSPLLRIRGEGKANYLQQTVDFLVSTSVVGTLEGQGGKDIDELRDVTIPINISGQWSDPKFKLVFDDVLRQKAEKEIDRGLEKLGVEIKDEKTKKAVDGLLKSLFK